MAFKISQSRPKKVQKRIAAFEDADNEDDTAGSSKAAGQTLAASANRWMDKGTAFAEAGDSQAALRCWDQAALVGPL